MSFNTQTTISLDKKSVEISGDKFTVTLDGVNTTATTISQSKTLTNGTLSYQAAGTGEYYTATEKGVTYTAQTGGEQFTLTRITNKDGVTISGKEVTVNEAALDMTATAAYTVELNGGDFTLKFNGNTSNTEIPASLKNGKYTSAYTPAYFTGSGKTYTFTPATNQETCTITGLSDNAKLGENVSISGKTVTLSADALTTGNVTIDGDYKLELDSKVTEPATATEQNTQNKELLADWSAISSGAATYHAAGTLAGWTKTSDQLITYTADTQGENLFQITGLPEKATLATPVKQTNGYKITLPSGSEEVTIAAINATLDGSTIAAGEIKNLTAKFAVTVTISGSATVNGLNYTAANGGLTIATTANSSTLTSGAVRVSVAEGKIKSITGLTEGTKTTYNGKTYTRTGDFIYNGTNYFKATDSTELLKLVNSINYIPITDAINLAGVKEGAIFGINGKEIASYTGGRSFCLHGWQRRYKQLRFV